MSFLKSLFSRKKSIDIGMLLNWMDQTGSSDLSGFGARVREGYKKNGIVYRAVGYIATAAGDVPWILYSGDEKTEVPQSHPILQMLRRPNPMMGQARFFQTFVIHLYLAGKAFIHGVRAGEAARPDGKQPRRQLHLLRPDCVALKDRSTPEKGWLYHAEGRSQKEYAFEDIRPFYMLNPLDDWEGLSPVEVATLSILQANQSREWNKNMLSKGAVPSGIIQSEVRYTAEQRAEIIDAFISKFGGASNAGKPLFLQGMGLKWEQASLTPTDMQWMDGQRLADRMNSVTMGVPPQMLGDKDAATYANFQEARRSFYEEHIIPLLGWVRDEFNAWFVPEFGENLALDLNLDGVTALQEQQEKKWDRVAKSDCITLNEKRLALGYEEVQGGDVIVLAGGKAIILDDGTVFISSAMKTVEDVIDGEPEPEIPLDPEAIAEAESEDEEAEEERSARPPLTKALNLTAAEKDQLWRETEEKRAYFIQRARGIITKLLKAESREVVQAIRFAGYPDGAERAAISAIERSDEAWKAAYERIYVMTAVAFAKTTHARMKAVSPEEFKGLVDNWAASVVAYAAKEVSKKVRRIVQKTVDAVKAALGVGIERGDTPDMLARTVEALYVTEIIPKRAELVAKTEVVNASNLGAVEAARSASAVSHKEWISSRDERVRSTHVEADGQVVQLEDPFLVGGFEIPWPGDSSLGAPASEIQNCRCFVTFRSGA